MKPIGKELLLKIILKNMRRVTQQGKLEQYKDKKKENI